MEKNIKTISILGCGWLGLAFAEKCIANNISVKGSTTNIDKFSDFKKAKIEPFLIQLPDNNVNDVVFSDFLKTDVLMIALPPKVKSKGAQYHIEQLKKLTSFNEFSSIKEIIYVSSTSVYIEENKVVNELSNTIEDTTLVHAEDLISNFCKAKKIQYTILRCGGLMGFDRYPAKYANNKTQINGNKPVNYIHLTDLVEIIFKLMFISNTSEIYNVCAPLHPNRVEVFTKNYSDANIMKPIFEASSDDFQFKIIDSHKIIEKTNFNFKYPDPLNFLYNF